MNDLKSRFFLRLPRKADPLITLAVLSLSVFSLLMVVSASMGHSTGKTVFLLIIIIKQLGFFTISWLLMILMAHRFNLNRLLKYLDYSFWGMVVLLLIPRLFPATGGTYGWIYLPLSRFEVTIQPAEFAKIYILVYMAALTHFFENKRITNDKIIFKILFGCGLIVFLIMFVEHDFGSAVVLTLMSLLSFLSIYDPSVVKIQKYAKLIVLASLVVVILSFLPWVNNFFASYFKGNYKFERFTSANNPFIDQFGAGFQLVKGIVAMAIGGFTGAGYGKSIQKYANFPAADTDFILTIIIEEFGILGYIVIATMYLMIIWRLLTYAAKINQKKYNKYRLILVGTALYFTVHFIFNVGGVSGLIPLTGVPLILVSNGGSSMMSVMIAIGISQNIISKYNRGLLE